MSRRQNTCDIPELTLQGEKKNTWPIVLAFLKAFLPSYCHYRWQTASFSSLHAWHGPFRRNTVPLWREDAASKRDWAEKKIPVSMVIICHHAGTQCPCPSEGLQLSSSRRDQSRQGSLEPLPAWLPRGGGQAPSWGPEGCDTPAWGHPGAGRSGSQGPLHLYGEFLQEKLHQPILYFLTPAPIYILRCS